MASTSSPAPSERQDTEQQGSDQPRTVSGKRPSAAALQREREYIDWLSMRSAPEGDGLLDDSWHAFMAERRARQEKARLEKINERRRKQQARHERR